MSENHNKPSVRDTVTKLIAAAVAIAIIALLFSIYIAKVISWSDVYAVFGIKTGIQAENDSAPDESARVTFLDVGQGDCIIIEDGESVAVIDCGEYTAESVVDSFLKSNKIENIDYLISTHPHTDHMGSMEMIVENYGVDRMLFTRIEESMTPTNSTYRNLLEAVGAAGISVEIPSAGEKITLGEGTLTVLYAGPGSDVNNSSLVLKYDFGETSFLLMGDAEFEVEDMLCEEYAGGLSCDVLKAGHHGTKKATGNNILEAASPEYVVIMCGENNEYGYPKQAVLDRIAKVNATVLRTDLDGTVVFSTDGQELTVETEGAA